MSKWYETTNNSIAVSTRVRIARNIKGIPFPNRLDTKRKTELNNRIVSAIFNSNSALKNQLKTIDMSQVDDVTAASMVEKHLISVEFSKNRAGKTLILSDDETVSIMLGEEDHIRIQVIKSGYCLEEAYDVADKIDTVLSENMDFAFDENLGYLTSCPTNLGTGLRAGVMLHLPCLEAVNEISGISSSISKIGLTIRGLYGEGSKSRASLYQISNQVTLGISEKNAIENLKTITGQIIKKEEKSAELLDKTKLQDVVFRSYGLLSNARLLTNDELLGNLSNVILGERLGIIENMNNVNFALMFKTQPATLSLAVGNSENIDFKRAEIVRDTLS